MINGKKNLTKKLKLGIIDYEACNIFSVYNSFYRLGENPEIIKNSKDIKSFDKIVIPGVGSANKSINYLKEFGFFEEILNFTKKGKNILAICLGFQIFSKVLYEDGISNGFGFIDADVIKLNIKKNFNIGWCPVDINDEYSKEIGLPNSANFYFCHSYYLKLNHENERKFSVGNYKNIDLIPSLFIKDNLIGCQFHPEKSQNSGQKILQYFIKL